MNRSFLLISGSSLAAAGLAILPVAALAASHTTASRTAASLSPSSLHVSSIRLPGKQMLRPARVAHPTTTVSFFHQVKPILEHHCQGCHQPVSSGGKLILTTYAGFLQGGGSGPAFKPGHPESSLVLKYIVGDPPAMPKNQPPLAAPDVALIRNWIAQGGKDDTPVFKDPIDQDHPPVYKTAPVIRALAFSPDGRTLAVSGYSEVLLQKADGSGLVARLVGKSRAIESLAYSPDGKLLAVSGGAQAGSGEIQLWDPTQAKQVQSITTTNDTVFGVSFSPDGKKVAVGGADNSVRVFSVPDGKPLIKFDNHSDWVFGTTFTSDSKHLVSASRDQALKLILLEGETGSFVDDINTHNAAVRCLVRLPKEDKVLCGEDDGVVRLYQVYRTQPRTMNNEDHNLLKQYEALPSPISALAVNADGSRVAAADITGDIRVFNVSDGKTLVSLKTYNGGIFAMAFHPDGIHFATGGFDGKVRIYSSTGQLVEGFVPVPISRAILAAVRK